MWDSPEMFKIYRMICVVGMIYGVVMIIITGVVGYFHMRFMNNFMKRPKMPPVPPLPKLKKV